MSQTKLPKEKGPLREVLKNIIATGARLRNIQRVEWLINSMYMGGARRFTGVNYELGTVEATYENTRGEHTFRYEEALRKYQTEIGRLLRIDESPHVKREGNFSLDGIRNASMAQAALDTMFEEVPHETIKEDLLHSILTFGTAGLACWGQASARLDRHQAVWEVIPPWELLPVPAQPTLTHALHGLIRYRYVTLDWLKTLDSLDLPEAGSEKYQEMDVLDVPYGENPETYHLGVHSTYSAYLSFFGETPSSVGVMGSKSAIHSSKQQTQIWVRLAEAFMHKRDETLTRYVVMVGNYIASDEDYTDDEEPPTLPIGIARYIQTTGFYGRPFVSLVLPINIEVEYLLRSLFENAQDLDQFGYLMLPASMGIDVQQFKKTSKPKYMFYEPDLTVPEHKPFALQPANTGDWPGKVAMLGRALMKDLAGQPEMLSGESPGRVDSASALGLLQETSNIPLTPVAHAIAAAYKTVYRAMLGMARANWSDTTLARITLLDDAVIGIDIDPDTREATLDKSAIPHPSKVRIEIKAAVPRSTQQRKMELMTMLQQGIIDHRTFRRISNVEGLDFPVGHRAEFENYRKATLNNIILFGDGKTPKQVIDSESTEMPDIQLEVINEFMARPEYMLASKEVRAAFKERKEYLTAMLGNAYPEGLEHPEDMPASAPPEGVPAGPGVGTDGPPGGGMMGR